MMKATLVLVLLLNALAALWYDFYWQKKQLIPLIEKIQQLNTD